jgi:predicted esterase
MDKENTMAKITVEKLGELVTNHFADQTYAEGLALATEHLKDFPDKFALVNYWRVCFSARLEAFEQANKILEATLASGIWYSEALLRQSPSLAALQGNEEFERLADISLKMQEVDPLEQLPMLVVRAEDACGPEDEKGCPVFLFLHGNDDTAKANLKHWHYLSTQGWLVALPQSSYAFWAGSHAWTDFETAAKEVEGYYAKLASEYALDPGQIVLGGFSMGAEAALGLALSGRIKAHGFVLLGPGGPFMDDLEKWGPFLEGAKERGLRGVILMGLDDQTIPQDNVRTLVKKLNANGVPTDLKTFPGLGHGYPEDFEKVSRDALKFIIG